ncbi:putative cobyrinic Acid a,c-diamide synthase [Roseibium sp. TrichSKD4]|uniref:ParA family protein n=1 Tax=Roseibium sp. TrichSKD4 TaxID=744980 RepID=UPI0001E56F39|nr:ParA family protein [Roseibium sp. TrichSKD4]EFO31316.1 putative cobyrinic Acid a,c-diamide synthase [Roseibium sp. TrichSKD4]
MGFVFSVLQNKGGAGKSTLVIALAGLLAKEPGARVIIVDTDKQESAAKWAAVDMPGRGHIDYVTELAETDITDLLRQLRAEYDYIIVDTAGFDSRMAGFVMGGSQLCLIPVKATVPDAQGAIATAKSVTATANMIRQHIPTLGVRMDFDPKTRATAAINDQLASYEKLEFADTTLWHATGFKDAMNTGEAVTGRAKGLTQSLLVELRNKKLLPLPGESSRAA